MYLYLPKNGALALKRVAFLCACIWFFNIVLLLVYVTHYTSASQEVSWLFEQFNVHYHFYLESQHLHNLVCVTCVNMLYLLRHVRCLHTIIRVCKWTNAETCCIKQSILEIWIGNKLIIFFLYFCVLNEYSNTIFSYLLQYY